MYEYRATVASIYDADTVRLNVDLGFGIWTAKRAFRLAGIDAPELGTPEGLAARDHLRQMLPVGTPIVVITIKDQGDKYGRFLAWLYRRPEDAAPGMSLLSVNEQLIEAGHARAYDGGPR